MIMQTDRLSDFHALGGKLRSAVDALDDPEVRVSGSDAASLARERRMMLDRLPVDAAAELRSDYDLLDQALASSSGSGAASVARERRLIAKLLEALEAPAEVSLVDQLAERRQSRTKLGGAASRGRKSG